MIEAVVNGRHRRLQVDPRLTLLEVLREHLFLTGTKEGCGVGECGTCVVLIDGEPIVSCLVLAPDAAGRSIETIEGLAPPDGDLTDVQRAFIETGGLQCGFCTPAMVLTVTALLRSRPAPDAAAVKDALGGVLCRCGAYPKIAEAVAAAGATRERGEMP
jgi:carbon-monoxide dehydrogenase small subunit